MPRRCVMPGAPLKLLHRLMNTTDHTFERALGMSPAALTERTSRSRSKDPRNPADDGARSAGRVRVTFNQTASHKRNRGHAITRRSSR